MNNRIPRFLFLLLGLFFVGLGLVGTVLPVLPTTPFMLLALGCFARSSQSFHTWLYQHPLFGPPLQRWMEHRAISPMIKAVAVIAMITSMVYVTLFFTLPWYALASMGSVIVYAAWFIVSKPSYPKNREIQ